MKTRTFEEVWHDLEKLKGQQVCTLVNHKRSDIINVESTGIKRRAETGKDSYINISEFKKVWKRLSKNGGCEIKESGPFVFECMALLPELEYSLNPVTIWLTTNTHEFGKLVEKT